MFNRIVDDLTMTRRFKTAIFISGQGSNMLELIKASLFVDSPSEIVLVLSNKKSAHGLKIAKDFGINTAHVNTKIPNYENYIQQILEEDNIELICLAGFMKILNATFVNKWLGKMINIHPSLLPKYKGLHTHQRALTNNDSEHGCTVHFVEPDVDSGPIIMQASLTVLPDDNVDSLASRILVLEHSIYPLALNYVATKLQQELYRKSSVS
jgi:phosphoribosylglycinamide formyltransferase-1